MAISKYDCIVPKEAFLNKLGPYIEEGILTDVVYISDEICIFVLKRLNYVAFPCALFKGDTALGFEVDPRNLVAYIEDPNLALRSFDKLVAKDISNLLHFNKENVIPYKDFFDKVSKDLKPTVNPNLTHNIKYTYSIPTLEIVYKKTKNIGDVDAIIKSFRRKTKWGRRFGCLGAILLFLFYIFISFIFSQCVQLLST